MEMVYKFGKVLTFVKEGVNGPGSKDRDPNPQPEDWDWVHERVAKKLTRKIARELGSKFRSAAARDDADYIAIGFAGSIYDSPKAKAIIEKVKNMYPEQLVFSGISTLNRGKGEVTFEVNNKYALQLNVYEWAAKDSGKIPKDAVVSKELHHFQYLEDGKPVKIRVVKVPDL